MSKAKRKTVGEVSQEILSTDKQQPTATEQMEECLSEYEENIITCAETHKKIFDGDFFIVVLTKKERLMQNVLRNFFFARKTCPTPDWDQAVYRYDSKNGDIELVWILPSKETCGYLVDNALELAPEQRDLLQFVLDDKDGTLLKIAKKINGEI